VVISAATTIVALIVGAEVFLDPLTYWLQSSMSISFESAEILLGIFTIAACLGPCVALYGATGRLAIALAARAVPESTTDDQLRPPGWESLVEIIQVALLIVVTVTVLALVQPFLQPFEGVIVLLLAILAMCVAAWRGVSRTLGQMRQAATLIASRLAIDRTPKMSGRLQEEVIPGLGVIVPARLEPGSSAIGKTLAQLQLPSSTGAVVVAIGRDHDGLVMPHDDELLREGDVLGLAGPHHAIRAAIERLAPSRAAEPVTSSALGQSPVQQ
jgi:CPA2 family monovalent cation:H+ antiporter-2